MSLLVAAIDFGTTFSGWAFSFKHEFERDPIKVCAKQWTGGTHVSLKGPTCALIKPNGTALEAFGYEAESKYAELALDSCHGQYYYFRRFKMLLHENKMSNKTINRNVLIEDANGKKLSAKTVFSLSIKYLKDDLLKMSENQMAGGDLTNDDIYWVLTVPAIWNDAAKQFMREAALETGIPDRKLTIALEPEAASLYCRHLPVEKCGFDKVSLAKFEAGTKYIVLDAGGGTVDITVHEVMRSGQLKELHKASGGAWGGTKVDDAFESFLMQISGADGAVMQKFKQNHIEDYLDLFRDFEVKKRELTPEKTGRVTIRIPTSFIEMTKSVRRKSLKKVILQTKFKEEIELVGDKIRIKADVVKSFFDEAVNSVVDHVDSLMREVQGCAAILMVGGFSESPMLQTNVKEKFSGQKIIVPPEAGLAVLKGAVIFGHSPKTIAERVCKYTYGYSVCHKKLPSCSHAPTRIEVDENGDELCYDLFEIMAQVGDAIELGEEGEEKISSPLYDNSTEFRISVYSSTALNPELVTERGCTEVGYLDVPIPDTSLGTSRQFGVSFIFGGTEIEVKVVDKTSGQITKTFVNFLG